MIRFVKRQFSISVKNLQFIDRCPPPRFDTGCTYCSPPEFPQDKQIDFTKDLNGTKADHWKHLLVVSSETNVQWPSKIELSPGSLVGELTSLKRTLGSPFHPVMVSNVDFSPQDLGLEASDLDHDTHTVLLFPERKLVRFPRTHVESFFKKYLVPSRNSDQEQDELAVQLPYNPFKKMEPREVHVDTAEIVDTNFEESDFSRELVAICGHGSRDIRCGELAPLLKDEFTRVINHQGLDVSVGYISHIGGHAYAGNVIYFGPDGGRVWYGRVFPSKVQGVVEETLMNGNVIKELYRGEVPSS
ncbi:hypothetical protein CAAN1_09S04192 [[Candida] anglica]|uniref:Altered inheritance of mitochondria protein 32 n=1 Tax=[Candida] anglica TaxID=148631 RepID=A0ABP0EFK4_9ASCO